MCKYAWISFESLKVTLKIQNRYARTAKLVLVRNNQDYKEDIGYIIIIPLRLTSDQTRCWCKLGEEGLIKRIVYYMYNIHIINLNVFWIYTLYIFRILLLRYLGLTASHLHSWCPLMHIYVINTWETNFIKTVKYRQSQMDYYYLCTSHKYSIWLKPLPNFTLIQVSIIHDKIGGIPDFQNFCHYLLFGNRAPNIQRKFQHKAHAK